MPRPGVARRKQQGKRDMNVTATSIDHHRADLAEREIFACSDIQADRIYELTKAHSAISGAVLINTCNRTELYLSYAEGICGADFDDGHRPDGCGTIRREDVNGIDPFTILCRVLGVDEESHRHLQRTMRDEETLRHLCLLTAGAESQLWGDSQIITQVGEAIDHARKTGASDAVLNTMFRLGITAGKEIRTRVAFHIHDTSTAAKAVERLTEDPEIRNVLVIGSGAIGRMVADRLAKAGLNTYMTLRKHHKGQMDVPEGVETVPYSERYSVMEKCEGVVSATTSPHVVVRTSLLKEMESIPRIMIDMAVPRDIEEGVGDIEGVRCYNIDDISQGHHNELMNDQLQTLEDYIEEHIAEYNRWERSRTKMEDKIARFTDPERTPPQRKHFPLFINTEGKAALVIGGGNIAERRVMTLAEFGFDILILSKELTETLGRMVEGRAAKWIRGRYAEGESGGGSDSDVPAFDPGVLDGMIDDAWMILACTNDRDINRMIGERCRSKGKQVNVCDARNESTFWFPAMALNDELTVGVVGKGTDHMNVKKAADKLRTVVEEKQYK